MAANDWAFDNGTNSGTDNGTDNGTDRGADNGTGNATTNHIVINRSTRDDLRRSTNNLS